MGKLKYWLTDEWEKWILTLYNSKDRYGFHYLLIALIEWRLKHVTQLVTKRVTMIRLSFQNAKPTLFLT